ncbi:von Willebrand factor A domain-containing protein 5A [Folsomia candida]|uniref:von Willebrand factor A domain-containing protein 5A n=1 Tax=Folsomia candida TaxID=158441 RepID=A0A226EC67_FOLCA|nr:von Willebrand factor A domain-containing protein 5A [Folsomia candida]
MLHKLAVVKLIRELEMKEISMPGMSDSVKEEIITLGIDHGITSKHTSYIAVDEDQTELYFGPMQYRQIPSLYEGLDSMVDSMSLAGIIGEQQLKVDQITQHQSNNASATPGSSVLGSVFRSMFGHTFKKKKKSAEARQISLDQNQRNNPSGSTEGISGQNSPQKVDPSSSLQSAGEKLLVIINNHNFDGSFSLTVELCRAIGLPHEQVKFVSSTQGYDTALLATALAISYLTTHLKEQEDSWSIVVKKAEKWLVQTCPDTNMLHVIMASAVELLKSGIRTN